jgi:hypothetical protein
LYRVAEVPEDKKNDFFPSCLLLSTTIHIDKAIKDNIPTNYLAISWNDPEVTHHPMVAKGATKTWYKSGQVTPGKPHAILCILFQLLTITYLKSSNYSEASVLQNEHQSN